MRKFTFQSLFLFLLTSALILSACSDSNSTNNEEPPEVPDLTTARPDLDYFNTNSKAIEKALSENFQLAKNLTASMESLIIGFSSLPESYMSTAQNADATFDNGVWTWVYSASGGGASVSIRLTAEVTKSKTNWAMFLTLNSQEVNFDNYKYLDGFIQNDGQSGEWSFYPFYMESSVPVMTYDWNIESDEKASFTITVDQQSTSNSTFSYVKDSPDNTITITQSTSTSIIYWNDATQEGYYQADGEDRYCWDATSNNVTCTGS